MKKDFSSSILVIISWCLNKCGFTPWMPSSLAGKKQLIFYFVFLPKKLSRIFKNISQKDATLDSP